MSRNTTSSTLATTATSEVSDTSSSAALINTIKSIERNTTSSAIIGSTSALASNTISSTVIATSAPFSNSTATTNQGNGGVKTRTKRPAKPTKSRGGNPGNGGNGGGEKGQTKSSAAPTKIEAVDPVKGGNNAGAPTVASTTFAVAKPTKVQGGKPGNGGGRPRKPTKKQVITIIKTFFIFRKSHGAACPAVKKAGNKWNVLNDFFDDLKEAAAAACGHQFTACIKFNGPNFSVEECRSQKNDCAAVATTQQATASTPAVITATVIIPVEAAQPTDIPGSVVAIETIAPPSITGGVEGGVIPAPTNGAVVQPVVPSASPVPTLVPSSAPFSNSTAPGLRRRYR